MKNQWHIENPLSRPMLTTLNVIGGKWKPMVLHMLLSQTMRFGDLKKIFRPSAKKC